MSLTPWGTLVAVRRGPGRKVALALGPSKTDGRTRVQVWRHNSRRWTRIYSIPDGQIEGDAPRDWPQTRAAEMYIDCRQGSR